MLTALASSDQPSSVAKDSLAQTLTGIDVHKDADGVSVAISGDGRLLHEVTRLGEHRLVIDIPQVFVLRSQTVCERTSSTLEASPYGLPFGQGPGLFDLGNRAEYVIEPQGAVLVVKLKESAAGENAFEKERSAIPQMSLVQRTGDVNREAVEAFQGRGIQRAQVVVHRSAPAFHVRPVQMMAEPEATETHTPKEDLVLGETRYVGRRISLDFQQADISNVLRLIAEVSGFNIVIGENVKSKVTMKLVSVPWDQALDMILKMNGLGKIRQGNILWIDSLSNLAKQEDEEARAKDAKVKAEDLVDRVFYIRNLQANELMMALKQNLSPRGLMQISQGTNALVVRDTETKMAVLRQLIEGLDLEVPQVQIEARIVQADTIYARGLGVQWGIQNADFGPNSFAAVGNLTGPFAPVAGQVQRRFPEISW